MGEAVYKPGDIVPRNGIYRIDHHLHRLMHEATLTEGMRFPLCRKCEDAVRFSLVRVITGEVLPFRPTEILENYTDVKANGQSTV
jgi:hypothetical protein